MEVPGWVAPTWNGPVLRSVREINVSGMIIRNFMIVASTKRI
jgi:hypothetical protein